MRLFSAQKIPSRRTYDYSSEATPGAGCSFRFSGQLSIFRPESGRRCARCCNFFQRYDDRRDGECDPPLHDVDQYSELHPYSDRNHRRQCPWQIDPADSGAATSGGGKNSRSEGFVASAFNSSTSAAVAQTFQLQAEPAGNNSSTPSGTLNLLYGSGTAAPTETGLKISSKGVIIFAAGQTFPGGGSFCVATGGGFGDGGTTFVAPALLCPR